MEKCLTGFRNTLIHIILMIRAVDAGINFEPDEKDYGNKIKPYHKGNDGPDGAIKLIIVGKV